MQPILQHHSTCRIRLLDRKGVAVDTLTYEEAYRYFEALGRETVERAHAIPVPNLETYRDGLLELRGHIEEALQDVQEALNDYEKVVEQDGR